MTNYFLTGTRKSDGAQVYWTGRAGDGFADTDRAYAWPVSRELGERRRSQFNEWRGPVDWSELVPVRGTSESTGDVA